MVRSIVEGERYPDALERLTGLTWGELQARVRTFSADYINEQLALAGHAEYRRAAVEYRQRHFERAAIHFQGFIRSYPESFLRANATYFVGESQFALERFSDAAEAFHTVVDEFPTHFYLIDDAQYRLGITYLQMGKREQAKGALERFLRDFTFANAPFRPAARRLLTTLQGG